MEGTTRASCHSQRMGSRPVSLWSSTLAKPPASLRITYNVSPLAADGYTGKGTTIVVFAFDGFDQPEARTGWLLRVSLDKQGVVSWDTVEARMDEDGVPHPQAAARTPCGTRENKAVLSCKAL